MGLNCFSCFLQAYGMEVTKRYPLAATYQSKDVQYCSSPIYSYIWNELRNRITFSKNLEKRRPFSWLGGTCTSLLPQRKVFNVQKESSVYSCPSDMYRYSPSKSNFECLRLRALPDPRMAAENPKSFGLLNTSLLKEITQQLLNIFHFQHICYLVNEVSKSYEAYVMENDFVDVTKMNGDAKLEGNIAIHTKNTVDTEICENITRSEVVHCDSSYMSDNKDIIMNSLSYSCSTVVETLPEMKGRLNDVSKEMVSRKQRQINKHSKKRKRRMKKKNKMASPQYSLGGGGTCVKKEIHPGKASQMKQSHQASSLSTGWRSRPVFCDSEDSDEDLCVIFEDEVDYAGSVLPEKLNSQSSGTKEISDLWVEFDSFTIVSGSSGSTFDGKSHSSEIFIQCDSDSECEADSGQIFVNANEFDSWSGLLFLSNGAVGCSGLQSAVHGPNFVPGTSLCEPPLVNDVGTHEIHRINRRWKEITSDVDGEPRLPQRVTFAPEEDLVAVFQVDMIDRKSEWEQFAIERFRFKRRVDEFEKIIAPYFTAAYREKVFRRVGAAAC